MSLQLLTSSTICLYLPFDLATIKLPFTETCYQQINVLFYGGPQTLTPYLNLPTEAAL